jgi:hypothetical protein
VRANTLEAQLQELANSNAQLQEAAQAAQTEAQAMEVAMEDASCGAATEVRLVRLQ